MSVLRTGKGEIVLPIMVKAKHDATSYESRGYQREIYDGNALYDAMRKAEQGSDWKPQVQKYEMTYLLGLAKMQTELLNRKYQFLPSSDFILRERGKVRFVSGEQFPDRIVKHSLCDEVLTPSIKPYLIYDNGASQEGKGIDFTRRRLMTHLRTYYAEHGSNEGYILLMDYSKYYDNIRHDILLDLFRKYVHDDLAIWLIEKILQRSRVDVSYMTDEEYRVCMNEVFNSLEHDQIDRSLLTGEKFMDKHMNIGDQVAQIAGILYPTPVDNYVKIVKGVKRYARYTDDSYAIHESREFLEELRYEVISVAASIGITVNPHKTRICKLSDYWRFLQIQYSLTDTGRVVHKINPERVTTMRRKEKKLVDVMEPVEFDDWHNSWSKNHYKNMSKIQRSNLEELHTHLKEEHQNVLDQTGKRTDVEEPRTEREQLYLGRRSRRQYLRRQSWYGCDLGREDQRDVP